MINKIKNHQSGQIAIIVLLASAVLLTLGMSASRKTITDTKIDTDEELLKEAFNTAESGINNYLSSGSKTYSSSGVGASITTSNIGGDISLSSEGLVSANTSQLFWLVNHNDDGTIGNTYYGSDFEIEADKSLNDVALKVDYYYLTAANVYSVSHFGCYTGSNTNFVGFTNNCSITRGTNRPLLVVVTPLGNSATLTVSGSSNFPIQGEELTAVGTAAGGVKTQIITRNVYQLPPFFFESMTAQDTIQ